MKKETNSVTAKLTSLWMTWLFLLRSRDEIETKRVPYLQRRKIRILMQVIIFLLHLMRLPLYWPKTCGPLANKSVGVLPPMW
ncbi:hypothetical protein Gotur_030674 [Gossypium turneri]